jgi:hypothetical protein
MHQRPEGRNALLIVTCRSLEEFERYLIRDGTGGTSMLAPAHETLRDLDDDEIQQLWQMWFGVDAPRMLTRESGDATLVDEGSEPPRSDDIRNALLHPAVLGVLRDLREDVRDAVVRGEEEAWGTVLQEYIRSVDNKVVLRTRCKPALATRILRAAAAASEGSDGPLYFEQHWLFPARSETDELATIKRVFESVVTAGVIVMDGNVASTSISTARIGRSPRDRSKNGRPHVHPLAPEALALRKERRVQRPDDVFVCEGGRGRAARSGVGPAFAIGNFVPHDLRRTAATRMAQAGVTPFIIARVLGHG